MKLFVFLITNNTMAYGGAQILRRATLFVFVPDGNGMRYKKKVGNLTTEYYYNGDQLLMENRPSVGRVYYLYDATGITGMIYQGEHYFFDKNTLGDIVSICDSDGYTVATYCYDAWGNVISKTGTLADANPFRYRGYYYDAETGFYYLQTRYYDPTIGRFINADNYELIAQLASSKELNMYAYCGNNPIMYTDPTGELFFTSLLIGIIAGAAIGGTIGGINAMAQGEDILGGVLSGILIGGVLGATTVLGGATALAIGGKSVAGFVTASTFAGKSALLTLTMAITATSSFSAGVGSYAIETSLNNREFCWGEAISSGTNTALKGLTNYFIGMTMSTGGAYSYLLKGAPNRTFGTMVVDGIKNGMVSNMLKLIQASWYYII